MNQGFKFLSEMGPLLVFFICHKFYGLIAATAALMITTIISVIIVYYIEKKVPMMPLISAILLGIFGGLTIFSQNELFIKIKPTLINMLFAIILIGGVAFKKGFLKYLMGSAMNMSDKAWLTFSLRWGIFFIFLAIVNEIVWRNFDTDFWVKFKVFGMLPLSIGFMVTQMPFLMKNMIENEKKKDDS